MRKYDVLEVLTFYAPIITDWCTQLVAGFRQFTGLIESEKSVEAGARRTSGAAARSGNFRGDRRIRLC